MRLAQENSCCVGKEYPPTRQGELEWAVEDEEPARAETVTEAEGWARELRAGRIAWNGNGQ